MKKFKCPKCKKIVDCDDRVVFRKCEECSVKMELNEEEKIK